MKRGVEYENNVEKAVWGLRTKIKKMKKLKPNPLLGYCNKECLTKLSEKLFFTLIQCKNISDDSKYLRSVHMKNAHFLPLNDGAHQYRIKLSQTPSIKVPPFTYESTNLDYSKK